MQKRLLKLCSWILTLALLINMLPMSIFAEAIQETAATEADPEDQSTEPAELSEAYIVDEITEKRTAYSKEFLLSSGVHMAAVYPQAVHYETANGWEEIDNTLITHADGSLSNTAGVWDVRFPGQLTKEQSITIEKDGYTLSFFMAGELTAQPVIEAPLIPGIPAVEGLTPASQTELSQLPEDAVAEITVDGTAQSFGVAQMQQAAAQVQPIQRDTQAQYAQTVPEKNHSRLLYADIYQSTDVVYDLESGKVKESVILESYRSSLRGYRYSLDVGEMIPVLEADGSVTFYDKTRQSVVMVMPAPYLVDNAGVYNGDIQVQLTGSGSRHTLFYILPTEWLAAEDRAWPVILDPIIEADLDIDNIRDRTVTEYVTYSQTWGMNSCGYDTGTGIQRFYLKYNELPKLETSDVILGAYVTMRKYENSPTSAVVEVRKVSSTWDSATITWANKPAISGHVEDYAIVQNAKFYGWTITDIVRDWYSKSNTGMAFKVSSATETGGIPNIKQFMSSDYGTDDNRPTLHIYFRNNNGLDGWWDYTTASAGSAGTGYINNYTGNLVWVHNDMEYGGNRMPVSINHVYNMNDQGCNDFALGYGWRTNYHQRIYRWSEDSNYYVWEDEDGTKQYFKYDATQKLYIHENDTTLTLEIKDTDLGAYCIKDKDGGTLHFDSAGRLVSIRNNQKTVSAITVSYTGTTGYQISEIRDGANRRYAFSYTDGKLMEIAYKGKGTGNISAVTFEYDRFRLTKINKPEGLTATFGYDSTYYIMNVTDVDGYKLAFEYNTIVASFQPYRITGINEFSGATPGGTLDLAYGHNQTKITDYHGNVQILQFNDYGNLVSVQDDEGHAQYATFAKNSMNDTGKGNQLTHSSKLQNTVANLVWDSNFEFGGSTSSWGVNNSAATLTRTTDQAYMGAASMKVDYSNITTEVYTVGPTFQAQPGKTYTFSAYVKTVGMNVRIGLTNASTWRTTYGESLASNQDWTRIQIRYTNTADAAVSMRLSFCSSTQGVFYVDGVQVEQEPTASRLNLVENGDFTDSGSPAYRWTGSALGSSDRLAADSRTAAPNLSSNIFSITGSPSAAKELSQTLAYSGGEGDCYVFSGWAWADSAVPETSIVKEILKSLNGTETAENPRRFDIAVELNYTDGTKETGTAAFTPSSNTWQYAAGAIAAKKAYSSITVRVRYHYNANVVWFDGIGLFKEQFGTSYTYDEDGNIISVTDLQKQTTEYEYDSNDNVTKVIQNNKAKMTYDYDNYHNVTKATSEAGLVYEFEYDDYGNNTSVSIVGKDGVEINAISHYSQDGNQLLNVWDPLNRVTYYEYNEDTGELISVRKPGDIVPETEGGLDTRTTYEYDDLLRPESITAAVFDPLRDVTQIMSVEYTYEYNNLKTITTPTTTYTFGYGSFGINESVTIGDRTLVTYKYHEEETDDRKNDLDTLDYGNGDEVQYEYDDQGRLVKETYVDSDDNVANDTVTYTYDNSGNLATRTDSATGITTTYYYDLTDRLMKQVQTDATGAVVYGTEFTYNALNNLTQLEEIIGGETRTTSYTYNEDNRIDEYTVGEIRGKYNYDSFGRLSSRQTKYGDTVIKTDTFIFEDLRANEYTSAQVSKHGVSASGYNKILDYEYDSNGNITKISRVDDLANDAQTVLVQYTYDTQNQLLSEVFPTQRKTVWTYDNAGNIQTRTEYIWENDDWCVADTVTYTYGDEDWGDLLTGYDGSTITHDAIGNPLTDGTWTYTWRHGRQLASMAKTGETWEYTYNADGLRTKRVRTVGETETTWEYIYSGSQLAQMTKGTDTLTFTYDANGTPMTVTHNGSIYYYVTNLQGDIIAILNGNGVAVAEYTYDAWGNPMGTLPTTGIGALNPLRYRGYVYDTETGLYYLQSRYYNPQIGRFINADVFYATGQGLVGNNMFAYCLNNPICMADDCGCLPFFVVTGVAFAFIGGLIGYVTTGTLKGALIGIAIGGVVGLAGGVIAAKLLAGSALASTGAVFSVGQSFLATTATGVLSQADRIAQEIGSRYRSFIQSNFRYNLQQLTGSRGVGMQAHHVFPVKFADVFSKAGININNPLYGSWVNSSHQFWSSAYNKAWEEFFNAVQNPTAQQIFEKAAELAKKFGFELNF